MQSPTTKNYREEQKQKTETPASEQDSEIVAKTISTSQQSYDSKVNNFSNLIQVLEQSAAYNPNEEDLKVTSLQNKLTDMKGKNTILINAYTEYSNAMLSRNQTLYDPSTGLCQIAKEVKQYVKSVFGTTSPQFKQISGIQFVKGK